MQWGYNRHTRTHTHTQLFYGSLGSVRNNLGEPVPEETFTHSHLPLASVIPYLLPPSSTIHGILPAQFMYPTVFSTISLQVFFGLPFGLAPSTPYSTHFFTQSLSFHSTCPYHHYLFYCSSEVMSSNPSLSLNPLFGTLSCSFTSHVHLTFSFLPAGVPPHFDFLWARSHFHTTWCFAHNCCTISLSLSMIYRYW